MTPSFLLAPGSGPQDYATRRAMIQAMMPQFGKASTIGEGLGQLFTGIGLGRQQKALDAEEAAARQSAMDGFNGLMSRGGTAQPGGFSILGPTPPVSPGQSVADDTMAALGYGGTMGKDAVVAGLVQRGLPQHIAEGFAMNFADESGFSTTARGDNGNAYGLAQWNGPRMAALQQYAAKVGKPASDMNTQLDFMVQELQGPEAAAWGKISAAQTPQEAAVAVLNHYERPAEQHRARREAQYSTAELAAAANNPMLPADMRAAAQQMLTEQQAAEEEARKRQDPVYQLQLQQGQLGVQKDQLELEQMQNPQPKPGFVQLSAAEVSALGLPPGVYQRGPDGRLDTVEKTPGAADPLAELKARAAAAGLREGTPEYQTFMLNGGKTQDSTVIESDGQGGFRMVQGAAAGNAAAKPFTEAQGKDVVYATRAKGALAALEPIANALTSRGNAAAGAIPFGLGGGLQSDDYQVAQTAGEEFLQAILRKDTGAGITAQEQDLYGNTYLPRPGDSEARLAYKALARQRAVNAIEAGMSPAQILAQERALEQTGAPVTINGYTIEEVK